MAYLKIFKRKFSKAMKEDDSFSPDGIFVGFLAFWSLLIPLTIILFGH